MIVTGPAVTGTPTMIDLPAMAARLGYPHTTIWRLVRAKVIPSIRAGRTYRVPNELVEEAYRLGCTGSLVLEDFAREWKTAHGWAGTPAETTREVRDGAA